MDVARYWVALFIVAFSPGIFLFWFSVHPLIRFWRRVGPHLTLALHYGLMIALATVVVLLRRWILAVEFGTRPVLVGLGAALFVIAAVLRYLINKQLPGKILSGLPELAPERYESKLLTQGVFAHVRHPRYAQLLLVFLAFALFSNYLAAYIVFLAGLVWVQVLVRVEEKELLDRFGEEFVRYSRQVPRRFIPRLSRRPSGSAR